MFRLQTLEIVLLAVGCVFTLVGSVVAALMCQDLPADLMLSLGTPTVVEGRVVSDRYDRYHRVNFVHATIFDFTYEVGGVRHQGSSHTTDPRLIAKLRSNGRAAIQVSPTHPDWARIEGTYVGAYGPRAAVYLIMPTLGVIFLSLVLLRRHRRVRAFTRGAATPGTLVYKGANTRVRINGGHPEMLRWEFSVQGVAHQGSINSTDPQAFTGLNVRDRVIVLYDPRDPANNVLYFS